MSVTSKSLPGSAQPAIHPRISVSQIASMNWTLAEDLAFYRSRGIRTVGILVNKLVPDVDAGVALIREAGISASCIAGGEMPMQLFDSRDGRTALDILRPAIDVAAQLGPVPCYFTSGSTPPRMPTDAAYDALVNALEPVRAYATTLGVRLAIENNSIASRDNGFIHTFADAAELAVDAGIGICLELQNAWTERHLADQFREHVDRLVLVQVSDFALGEAVRFNRAVPGDGSIPLEWLLGRLLDAGYTGGFEVEVLGPRIEEEGYASAIDRSVAWLNERLTSWGV